MHLKGAILLFCNNSALFIKQEQNPRFMIASSKRLVKEIEKDDARELTSLIQNKVFLRGKKVIKFAELLMKVLTW